MQPTQKLKKNIKKKPKNKGRASVLLLSRNLQEKEIFIAQILETLELFWSERIELNKFH
jgi:hypothetical protein